MPLDEPKKGMFEKKQVNYHVKLYKRLIFLQDLRKFFHFSKGKRHDFMGFYTCINLFEE